VTDGSSLFTRVAALSWVGLALAPILISIALDSPLSGAPLLGVALWLALLRVARWLSPAARADTLAQRGRYDEALAMCDQSLAVTGTGAWVGRRRLVWLNRRVTALLGLGRYDEALAAAIVAMEASPDPQTIANCSVALLRLDRYELAIEAARLASQLTSGRSVRANATLAEAMLARGLPAEAEALARVSLSDIQALAPYVRREHHAACLSALCRAQRALGLTRQLAATLARLRRVTSPEPALVAIFLLESAASTADTSQAAELVMRAHAANPAYTSWYLTQPGVLPALRSTPDIAPLVSHSAAEMQRMSDLAPDDEALHLLLGSLRLAAHPSPTYQSSLAALTTQVITLGATLALLLLWMWRFFISQTL
jgi:tetratricopeptide (TPR) repeat protein